MLAFSFLTCIVDIIMHTPQSKEPARPILRGHQPSCVVHSGSLERVVSSIWQISIGEPSELSKSSPKWESPHARVSPPQLRNEVFESTRLVILERLLAIQVCIPSIETFHEDSEWLEPCSVAIREHILPKSSFATVSRSKSIV